MKTLWWILGPIVAVVVVLVFPYVYKAVRGGDDAPAASVSTDGAVAATGELDGTWTVVPGSGTNETSAGYTVDEVLRGEPVTVVGSTDQVSGEATISDMTLKSAGFEVQVASIATDISQRDGQFRAPQVLDAEGHPVATLALAEPVGLAEVPEDRTTATVPMPVDLTVKGAEASKQVDVAVLRSGEHLIASGSVPMTWSEVGVPAHHAGQHSTKPRKPSRTWIPSFFAPRT